MDENDGIKDVTDKEKHDKLVKDYLDLENLKKRAKEQTELAKQENIRAGRTGKRTGLIPFKKGDDPRRRLAVIRGVEKRLANKKRLQTFESVVNIMLDTVEPSTGLTYRDIVTSALVGKAMEGDVRAFEVLRDTAGEKPKEKVENSGETTLVIKAGKSEDWSV